MFINKFRFILVREHAYLMTPYDSPGCQALYLTWKQGLCLFPFRYTSLQTHTCNKFQGKFSKHFGRMLLYI